MLSGAPESVRVVEPVGASEPAIEAEAASAHVTRPRRRTRAPQRKPRFKAVPDAEPVDALPAELALMRKARAALKQGRPSAAFTVARRHRADFPQGVLREEAVATEVRALCQLGRPAQAEAAVGAGPRSAKMAALAAKCQRRK